MLYHAGLANVCLVNFSTSDKVGRKTFRWKASKTVSNAILSLLHILNTPH